MEMRDITLLAAVLRDNGADVLNGMSKLILSTDLLNKLNSSFGLVIDDRDMTSSVFHVINNSTVKAEDFWDLKFLYDFVQCTVGLKLTHSSTDEFTDITKFKNLKLIELQKINVNSVLGMQTLRSKLHYLICWKSISTLSDVLEKCGGDASDGMVWGELKEAVFRHNNLQVIDGSLEFAPLLHTLDLSHNEISDAGPLNCLSNLKHLNLSYNKLNCLPVFSAHLCTRLQILVLKNNFLEEINEVTNLLNLRELDLSDNCLIEHKSLVPLANLATLQWLNLQGNPLSYHPQHRTKSSRYLHINTATVRFILDGQMLSRAEQKLVGLMYPRAVARPRVVQSTSQAGSDIIEKPRRIRHATISDTEQSPVMDCSIGSVASLLTSGEHLEAKRRIEELRKHYGERWLHNEAGSLVQDVLGLEKTPLPPTSTPYGSVDAFIQAEIKQPMHALETIEAANQESDNKSEQMEVFTTASDKLPQESSLYENTINEPELSSEDELGDGEESIYLATVKGEADPVFVVITDTHIIEKDHSSTERARWPTETLILCEDHESYVQLYFDTVRNDRRERMYELEEDESQRLTKTLSAIVAQRPPEEINLTVYKCLKCSSQFSKEKKNTDEKKITCPACSSTLVFEDDG